MFILFPRAFKSVAKSIFRRLEISFAKLGSIPPRVKTQDLLQPIKFVVRVVVILCIDQKTRYNI
jgi:hypothetical protein